MTKNKIVGEQQGADGDARICDVERGPMIVAGMYDDEIDNVSEAHAVCQITEDACEQEGTSPEHAIVVSWRAHEIVKDRNRRKRREYYKEPATE